MNMTRYIDAGENSVEVRMKSRDSRGFATTVEFDREIVCVMRGREDERRYTEERREERMREREDENERMSTV